MRWEEKSTKLKTKIAKYKWNNELVLLEKINKIETSSKTLQKRDRGGHVPKLGMKQGYHKPCDNRVMKEYQK